MSNIIINIDLKLGTRLEDALTEAKQKVAEWGVYGVRFKLNSWQFVVTAETDIDKQLCNFNNFKYGTVRDLCK